MQTQRCKGTRDLCPEEMKIFRLIEGIFRDSCLKWDYEEVRTPTLEYLHLFTSTGTLTPGMLRRVYSFLDWDGWSGERIVLKPDSTIPIARFYIENLTGQELAKFFYVSNVFIFEETGKETREKWQCGAELIGANSTMADVELMALALEVMKKLGLGGVELKLSHAGLIRSLLAEFGLSPVEQATLFDQLLDGNTAALSQVKPEKAGLGEALAPLLNLNGKSSGFLRNLKALFNCDLPGIEKPLNQFINIVEILDTLGVNYNIDMTSGRGFEYYTGLMFQLYVGDNKVGAGGRYDALIPLMSGKTAPASGFALYLDRLMALVKPEALNGPLPAKVLLKVESPGTGTIQKAFRLVESLHQAGYIAEMQLGNPTSQTGWTLLIRDGDLPLVLTDEATHCRSEVKTVAEIIAVLNG